MHSLTSGRAAARTVVDALQYGDPSVAVLARYQRRLGASTRLPFGVSRVVAKLMRWHPLITTAAIELMRSRGVLFFSEWVDAWLGSKKLFLDPGVALSVAALALKRLLRLWLWGPQ